VLPTPELFWVKVWLPDPVTPVGVPGSTLTAPASEMLPMDSNGAPMARSANPSSSKSPEPNATERVADLGGAAHPGAVLGEGLAAGSGQPSRSPVQHIDRASVDDAADGLERYAHGQVGEPVVVEITGGQREAERVELLGGAAHPGAVLGEGLAAGSVSPAAVP
jgi:hypothetical protein